MNSNVLACRQSPDTVCVIMCLRVIPNKSPRGLLFGGEGLFGVSNLGTYFHRNLHTQEHIFGNFFVTSLQVTLKRKRKRTERVTKKNTCSSINTSGSVNLHSRKKCASSNKKPLTSSASVNTSEDWDLRTLSMA